MPKLLSKVSVLFLATLTLTALFGQSCSTFKTSAPFSSGQLQQDAPWLQPKILNSDRIKAKFGSYGVKVLLQDEPKGLRISNLFSAHNNEVVMRVLAMVDFVPTMDPRLSTAHREIVAGGSIGSVLIKHQFAVDKRIVFKDEVADMPKQMVNAMRSSRGKFATVVYELKAKVGNELLPYCTITEVYSPDFLRLADLELIFARERGGVQANSKVSEVVSNAMPAEAVAALFRRLRDSLSSIAI